MPSQFIGVTRIGVEGHAIGAKNWSLCQHHVRFLIFVGQRAGFGFAGFYIWLIKRIDSDDGASNCDRKFPTNEFLANVPDILKADPTTGWPALASASTASRCDGSLSANSR